MLGFQRLSVCIGFEEFPEKKCLQFLCPERNQGACYYLSWCSHLWVQIKPNVIKLLLVTNLSSSVIPVLSSEQSGVSAKIAVNISAAERIREPKRFSFSSLWFWHHLHQALLRHQERWTGNECCNLKWHAVQHHSSVSREFVLELNK